MERVALIGTGTMGAPMARCLARSGLAVTVWNRTRGKAEALRADGIAVAGTPAEAARGVEAVGIMVADDAAVAAVLEGTDGVLAGIDAGALVIDSSTTSVAAKRRFAEHVREAGGRPVAAPVFGSRPQAEEGGLWPVVGASEEDAAAAEPFLRPLADEIFHVGDPAAAAALKLAGNLIVFSMVDTLAESLALAVAEGVSPRDLLRVVGKTGFRSPYYELKGRQMIEGDYEARVSIDIAAKDLGLMLAAAAERGLRLPATEATKAVYDEASAAGHGGKDMAALFEVLRP